MNTGHDGSMSTAHANSPVDLLARLEAMAAGARLPTDALRRQIAAALDLVVHVARKADGARAVTGISELGDDLTLREVPM